MESKIAVSHINIRLSVSTTLLLKLVFIEVLAAACVIFLHTVFRLYSGTVESIQISLFNIPLFLFLVFLKTFLTLFIVLEWMNEYYEITQTAIFHRKGIFFKDEENYPLEHIGMVETYQSTWGEILNFGTISLYDRRRNKYVDMYLIHNPKRYARIIEDLLPYADYRKSIVRDTIFEKKKFNETHPLLD